MLFGEGESGTSLVLVGDPKQAIYGFRGGDIETYIGAVGRTHGSSADRCEIGARIPRCSPP